MPNPRPLLHFQAPTRTRRSTDPADYQSTGRPVAAMAKRFADGTRIAPHRHARAQFIHAVHGLMTVHTSNGAWVVPPSHALWMPAGEHHAIDISGEVDMRTLYLRADVTRHLPDHCVVLTVSPLLRELIVRATELPVEYDETGPAGAIMGLILDEIDPGAARPLHLPMPVDRRLRRLCQQLQRDPGETAGREALAEQAGLSARSLSRLFRQQTGLGFAQWRSRARLFAALSRLSTGQSVTSVALDLGYTSPSAFTAMFRREFGTTPAGIAREINRGPAAAAEARERGG